MMLRARAQHLGLVAIPLRAPLQVPFIANYGALTATLQAAPDLIWDGLRRLLNGQDARRFKRCPVCDKFFIATRFDKPACSPRCVAAERQRRHRANRRHYEQRRKFRRAGVPLE